jgi:hypothetical protein
MARREGAPTGARRFGFGGGVLLQSGHGKAGGGAMKLALLNVLAACAALVFLGALLLGSF